MKKILRALVGLGIISTILIGTSAACLADSGSGLISESSTYNSSSTSEENSVKGSTASQNTVTYSIISTEDSTFTGFTGNAESFDLAADDIYDLLCDKKLGTLDSSLAEQQIRKIFPDAEIYGYATFPDIYTALSTGKIDYIVTQDIASSVYLNTDTRYQYGTSEVTENPDYFAVKKGNTELRDKINSVLAKFNKDGTTKEIIDKWLSGNYSMDGIPKCTEGPVLRVAISATSEPVSFIHDNEIVGLDVEMMQRIAYELGMQLEIVEMNFNAVFSAMESGKIDVITSLSYTDERAQTVEYTDKYMTEHIIVIRYQDGESSIGFIDSLKTSFIKTFITENRWLLFLNGLGVTVLISVMAFILATFVGILLCRIEMSRFKVVRKIVEIYCKIVTRIPILVWLMILYYIVFGNVDISAVFISIIGFGLVSGANLSGVFKTGLESVDKGQIEAAAAIGFSQFATFRKIVLPQAASHIFDLYAGEFSTIIQSTSVVGYIAIMDLTKASDMVRSRTFEAFFPLIATAIIYFLIICLVLSLLKLLQRKFKPKLRKKSTILKGVVTK